ncbi:MAG: RsmD family RNA methyltransferase [Bacteroidaceae bacterium]|nr:RsmD family RNA methyltransferase [Bacteroidaceae bacterium]
MRVISGIYRHRRFDVPNTFKARPTTDFAKENLFNILANRIDFEEATALDLFSGTGSISIELLSRGCQRVVSVEKEPEHYAFISKVMETVRTDKSLIVKGDVFKYLERCQEQFDFIFADPPYQLEELPLLPEIVLRRNILKADGMFVLEHGSKHDFKDNPRFVKMREYGSVHFSFFV